MRWRKAHRLPSLRGRIIASSLFTAAVLLVVCTTILLMLILNVLRGYIHNDLEFVLQQTLSNMDDKTLLLEDTLLRLRSDEGLMAVLQSETGFSGEKREEAETLLGEQAGLGLTRNSANLSKPFLDMVYLYDRNGACVRVSYRESTPNVQETWDAEYGRLYRRFQAWPGGLHGLSGVHPALPHGPWRDGGHPGKLFFHAAL